MASDAYLSVKIYGNASINGHIEHDIRVTLARDNAPEESWVVHRRYREFRALHEGTQSALKLKPFAVPKLIFHTQGLLQKRETLLQELLSECIRSARAAKRPLPELERFLGMGGMGVEQGGGPRRESDSAAQARAPVSTPRPATSNPQQNIAIQLN